MPTVCETRDRNHRSHSHRGSIGGEVAWAGTGFRVALLAGPVAPSWAAGCKVVYRTPSVVGVLVDVDCGGGPVPEGGWVALSPVHHDPELVTLAVCQARLAAFQRFLGPGNLFHPLDLPPRESDLAEVGGAMARMMAAWRSGGGKDLDLLIGSELKQMASGARGGRRLQICFGLVRAQWVEPYREVVEVDRSLGTWAARLSDDGAALDLDDYLSVLCPYLGRLGTLVLDRRDESLLDQAITFVKSHSDRGLTMAMVANHFSMNYSQFSREFKEHSGQGFHDFLLKLRIERSMDLLRESPLKIFEVAQKAGYRNTKHFLKIFKERVGLSPTEYRRALAGR